MVCVIVVSSNYSASYSTSQSVRISNDSNSSSPIPDNNHSKVKLVLHFNHSRALAAGVRTTAPNKLMLNIYIVAPTL